MKRIFLLLLLIVAPLSALVSVQPAWGNEPLRKAVETDPESTDRYVVLVSMDGFRWDYGQMYRTPFLDSLGQAGVAARMRPSYPSKTFPNHYTIATGLVPDHHGIVANRFIQRSTGRKFSLGDPETKFDGSFYGGEPIWITAAKQGVKTGVVYWPGSDVEIKGMRPAYYHQYDGELLTFDQRLDEVHRYLTLPEAERPHLVMCYFDEPDATGHRRGPIHPETRARVESLDSLMRCFVSMIQSLPIADQIDLIITSDHGMVMTSPERLVRLSDYIDMSWITAIDYSVPVMLNARRETRNGVTIDYADSIVAALRDVPHIQAWRRSEVPAYLQFGSNENVGDVIINPAVGWVIGERYTESTGTHGYDPFESDLQVIFRAIGPHFKQSYVKPDLFQNVCVYPLICHLLGIVPAEVDGSVETVSDLLIGE